MKSLNGKVAAVTGAGSGIGRALAVALASEGAHLALADVNQGALEETASLVRAPERHVTHAVVDVADRAAVHAWADATARTHGVVNLVFNNAGVALAGTLEGMAYEDLHWIMGINFWGVVHGTKAFLPHLRASGDGHVVNVSSVFGLVAVPGQGAYNASKFAVRGFTEALRLELEMTRAPVSATVVLPGGVKTNIARSARITESLSALHAGGEKEARQRFERLFRTPPARAAEAILRAVKRNRRRVLIGSDAHFIDSLVRLAPEATQRLTLALTRRLGN